MRGGFADGPFLDFRDTGRDRDHDPRFRADPASVHFRDEMPKHRFGHFKVCDDAVFQRADRDNV